MVNSILNKIVLWDTNQLIKQLPEKCIDLVVTDPPYLIQQSTKWFASKRKYMKEIVDNDQFSAWFDNNFLNECKRVLKKFNWYFFCNKMQIKQYLDFVYENDYLFDILTWCKTNPSPLCWTSYLPDTEYVIFIREKWAFFWWEYKTKSKFWVTPVQKNKFDHPTSKPLFLMERMVTNSSNEWDVVLDPFMWSWSTAVVCKNMNRSFIWFEMEQKYIDISIGRLNEWIEVPINYQLQDSKEFFKDVWMPQEVDAVEAIQEKTNNCTLCGWLIKNWWCEDCLNKY
jgi:DNA modification methylase